MSESGTATLSLETKRLARNSFVYLLPNLLISGVSVFLTPLYARAMGPDDLAVVAVANSIIAVLGTVLGLSLYGCIPRLFVEYDAHKRRLLFGSLLVASLVFPIFVVSVLFLLGSAGRLDMFENVRFEPHLQLVLLTSLAGVYRPLVVTVYIAREEPGKVAVLSLVSAIAQLALTLLFVIGLGQGALGVLSANFVSGALTGVVAIILMARLSSFDRHVPGLVAALAFSLPLVPHLVANWALGISDRLILDHYVASADLGRYSLAYTFNLAVGLMAFSVVTALTPMANRQLKVASQVSNVPPLGTYALLIVVTFALGLALSARELIALIAPPSYADSIALVPWVVLGAVFQGVYLLWSLGTWFSMRTRLVPTVTAASALVNVALNLVFVPRYGVVAAAVSTAISYAVLAAMHGALAQRLHPIRWEYGRWARMLALGIVWYLGGLALPIADSLPALAAKGLITLVAFPVSLALTGFFTRRELARLMQLVPERLRIG